MMIAPIERGLGGQRTNGSDQSILEMRLAVEARSDAFELGIYKGDGTWRMSNRVTRQQIAHFFALVTRAGAASRRPYGRNSKSAAANARRTNSSRRRSSVVGLTLRILCATTWELRKCSRANCGPRACYSSLCLRRRQMMIARTTTARTPATTRIRFAPSNMLGLLWTLRVGSQGTLPPRTKAQLQLPTT